MRHIDQPWGLNGIKRPRGRSLRQVITHLRPNPEDEMFQPDGTWCGGHRPVRSTKATLTGTITKKRLPQDDGGTLLRPKSIPSVKCRRLRRFHEGSSIRRCAPSSERADRQHNNSGNEKAKKCRSEHRGQRWGLDEDLMGAQAAPMVRNPAPGLRVTPGRKLRYFGRILHTSSVIY